VFAIGPAWTDQNALNWTLVELKINAIATSIPSEFGSLGISMASYDLVDRSTKPFIRMTSLAIVILFVAYLTNVVATWAWDKFEPAEVPRNASTVSGWCSRGSVYVVRPKLCFKTKSTRLSESDGRLLLNRKTNRELPFLASF
jgi:hypothetical protein